MCYLYGTRLRYGEMDKYVVYQSDYQSDRTTPYHEFVRTRNRLALGVSIYRPEGATTPMK